MLARNGLAHFLEACDRFINSHLNALAEHHGVCAGSDILHALMHDSLCKKGCGGGAVACNIVGLGSDLTDELCAHILKRVGKLDLLSDGDAIVGDEGCAVLLFKNYITALGSKGDFNCISKGIETFLESPACFFAMLKLLCHNNISFYSTTARISF